MTILARRFLITCDGAAIPPDLAVQEWTARREIHSAGPNADLELSLAGFGGAILKSITPRSTDLIRLAAYIYRADQIISRGGGRDAHARRWKRHLALCVPVADPAFWSTSTVTEHLAAALRFLTDDLWEFAFAEASPELTQLPLEVPPGDVIGQPTSIVPFSGGIDSLCVLLEHAANAGRPVVVSHWSTGAHKARQLDLLAQVRQRFRGWSFPLLGLPLHGKGGDAPDSSQRSRGFLYAAFAAAVGGELGLERVLFGDNGPVSINLPINDQLVGALASRATHPQFLYRFNQLARELYPISIEVTNPLRERTRAEALEVLKGTQCVDLMPMTLSCSKWRGLPAATPHCGGCSQCVDRRFATVAARLEEHDPASRYRRDVFLDEPINWEADETAQSYVRFARRVYQMDDAALVEAFPQLYDLPTADDSNPEATVFAAVELAKRHATATLGVLKTMFDRHRDALVEGSLPSACLLRKVVAEDPAPAIAEAQDRRTSSPLQLTAITGSSDAKITPDENVFAFEGQLWTLSYGGTTKYMPDSVGLSRLAVLLREPQREFRPEEILLAVEGTAGATMSQAEAEFHELWPESYAGGGTKLDSRALGEVKGEVMRLLQDVEHARDNGDSEEIELLEARIRRITQEVDAGVGFGGKLKPFIETRSRRHESVYRSLFRVLPQVTKIHPILGKHLTRSIHLKTPFSYAPEGNISWRVVLPQKQA